MSNEVLPAKEQFFGDMDRQHLALTYDDISLETRHGRGLEPPMEPDLSSHFSRNVPLRFPFVSAAMDKVTESDMAIAMAEAGGIGVIHAGQSPENQKHEVRRVKLHMNGRIDQPITVKVTDTLGDILRRCDQERFGFRTFPVEDSDGRFVGLLSSLDFKMNSSGDVLAVDAMKPVSDVLTARTGTNIQEAYDLMQQAQKPTLPILDDDGRVEHMYLYSDADRIVNQSSGYNLDEHGRLYVAAAIPTDHEGIERVRMMIDYLDVAVLDSANGDSYYAFKILEALKSEFPNLDVVVGNVSNGDSAAELARAGADGVKVGQGPGSICTTRVEIGIGMPQATAVYQCRRAVEAAGIPIPICADGGIRVRGDIPKALALGASSVMMGNMLSGTDETPGEIIIKRDGSRVKAYRGMGSESALQESSSSRKRYGAKEAGPRLPEGVEAEVPYKGSVHDILVLCKQSIINNMRYVKAYNLPTMYEEVEITRVTRAGLSEAQPHDVTVVSR